MSDLGFEPDRVRRWMATPIGAKVVDDNPVLQRTADVVLAAMAETGSDPLIQVNVLVKLLAMVIGGMARFNSVEDIAALCGNLGPTVQLEARDFLRKLRRDIGARRDDA